MGLHVVERQGNGWVIMRERIGRITVEVKFRHISAFKRRADAMMVAYWLNRG